MVNLIKKHKDYSNNGYGLLGLITSIILSLIFVIAVFVAIYFSEKDNNKTYDDFIEIEKLSSRNYIVYNSETKLVYRIINNQYMIQLWDYDEEGHPIAKYYEGDVDNE